MRLSKQKKQKLKKNENAKSATSTNTRIVLYRIKHGIALTVSVVSLLLLGYSTYLSHSSISTPDAVATSSASVSTTLQSHSFAIYAGYLIFDHWYSAYYKLLLVVSANKNNNKNIWQVSQDVVVLTGVLIVLVTTTAKQEEGEGQEYYEHHGRGNSLSQVVLLGGYLLYNILWNHMRRWKELQQQPAATAAVNKKEMTTKTIAVPAKAQATRSTTADNNLWIIHGSTYDLQDYVNRHPGGKEAILLGQSRDCTALFESYHPFTQAHWNVLQKYKVDSKGASATNSGLTDAALPPRDAFYAILCQRVQDRLLSLGIDPIVDRTATPLRRLYYGTVIACVLISGYAHCKVRKCGS
jgi:cytochrome b involved in lipid metabolism